jgi:hypothetical protein
MSVKIVSLAAASLLLASSAIACDQRAEADNAPGLQVLAQSGQASDDELTARKRERKQVRPRAVAPRSGTMDPGVRGSGGTSGGPGSGTSGAAPGGGGATTGGGAAGTSGGGASGGAGGGGGGASGGSGN